MQLLQQWSSNADSGMGSCYICGQQQLKMLAIIGKRFGAVVNRIMIRWDTCSSLPDQSWQHRWANCKAVL